MKYFFQEMTFSNCKFDYCQFKNVDKSIGICNFKIKRLKIKRYIYIFKIRFYIIKINYTDFIIHFVSLVILILQQNFYVINSHIIFYIKIPKICMQLYVYYNLRLFIKKDQREVKSRNTYTR